MKDFDAGRSAEHGLQIGEGGEGIEVRMHEGEIFDFGHVASFGPNTHFNVRQVLLQRLTPSLCGADVLIEADDEQRHVITERFGPQCAADCGLTPFESAEDQGGVRA